MNGGAVLHEIGFIRLECLSQAGSTANFDSKKPRALRTAWRNNAPKD